MPNDGNSSHNPLGYIIRQAKKNLSNSYKHFILSVFERQKHAFCTLGPLVWKQVVLQYPKSIVNTHLYSVSHGHNRIVVGFITIYAISAYHH